MQCDILFFSHNKRHYQFFKGVVGVLNGSTEAALALRHLINGDHVPNHVDESTNARIIRECETLGDVGAELARIDAAYPQFDALHAMTGDRVLNFFPRYLNHPKTPREVQERYLFSAFRVLDRDLDEKTVSVVFSELMIGLQDAVMQVAAVNRGAIRCCQQIAGHSIRATSAFLC